MIKIDLHGQIESEALINLRSFFNECEVKKTKYASIIHGNGEYVLMRLVQEEIKKHNKIVDSFFAPPNLGGTGVTIVVFKWN